MSPKPSKMMKTRKIYIAIGWLLFLSTGVSAQKKRDSLQSQTVTVTRSYTPLVPDADKIEVNAPSTSIVDFDKRPVSYKPLKLEAVSTFTAEKAKSRRPSIHLKHYEGKAGFVELFLGNMKAIDATAHYGYRFPSYWIAGGNFSYRGLGEAQADSLTLIPFSDLNLTAFARKSSDLAKWRFSVNYARTGSTYRDTLTPEVKSAETFGIHRIGLSAGAGFNRTVFKNSRLNYVFLTHNRLSEHNLHWKMHNLFPVAGFNIQLKSGIDLISGNPGIDSLAYTNFLALMAPSFKLDRERFHFMLGFKLFYQNRDDINDRILFYPDISMDYNMVYELLTLYITYEGAIYTRSYRDLLETNRYLFSGYSLIPTSVPFHFSGGFRGQIGTRVMYDLKLGVAKEKNMPLFYEKNSSKGLGFGLVYDDMDYYYFKTVLGYVLPERFETKMFFEYYQYSPATQAKAWNLPDYKLSWLMRFNAGKFYWENELYYVGPRYDKLNLAGNNLKSDGFVSANLQLGYRAGKDLNVYLRGNNLLNQKYFIYTGYPVHGLHIMAGVYYGFQ